MYIFNKSRRLCWTWVFTEARVRFSNIFLSVSASRSLLQLLTSWTRCWRGVSHPGRVDCMPAHARVGTRARVYDRRFLWCSPSLLTRTHITQQFANNVSFSFGFVHFLRKWTSHIPPPLQKKTCTLLYHTNDNILYELLNNSFTRYMCVYAWICDYRCNCITWIYKCSIFADEDEADHWSVFSGVWEDGK